MAKTLFFSPFHKGVCTQQCPGAEVLAPTQPHSSPPPPSSVSPVSQVTGLNTTLNVSIQRVNLDAQQCSQRRCSGNGHCVETKGVTTCVCSLGYSGDSCENRLVKTMQGPIVYAAVGLCAAVVIIVVIVLVKRKKSANLRFFFLLYLNLKFNFFLALSLSPWVLVWVGYKTWQHLSLCNRRWYPWVAAMFSFVHLTGKHLHTLTYWWFDVIIILQLF